MRERCAPFSDGDEVTVLLQRFNEDPTSGIVAWFCNGTRQAVFVAGAGELPRFARIVATVASGTSGTDVLVSATWTSSSETKFESVLTTATEEEEEEEENEQHEEGTAQELHAMGAGHLAVSYADISDVVVVDEVNALAAVYEHNCTKEEEEEEEEEEGFVRPTHAAASVVDDTAAEARSSDGEFI